MRGQPARGWAVAPAPHPMCCPGSVPLGSASRCPLLHPTAAAAPWGTPRHRQCHLHALNHATTSGCTMGLRPSLCPCAQLLALVWLCKPAHPFFPCASLLPMCIPSAQVHPFSSVTSPSACTSLLHMCKPSTCVHPLSSCASILHMCIPSYMRPFALCASLLHMHIPFLHTHPFSFCASLLHMYIPSPHAHPFSPYASLLPLCIPSPCVHPFSPYVSLLPVCIPSARVHPFSTCASLLPAGSHQDTMSGGSTAPPGTIQTLPGHGGSMPGHPSKDQGQLGWAGVLQPQRPACWIWPAGMMEQMMLLV